MTGRKKKIITNKSSYAYKNIKEKIINHEFKPGEFLVELQLCNMLNVSRTPIREALKRLATEGLVQFTPNKGALVSSITINDIIEIIEIREYLDICAIELCAKRLEDNIIEQLKYYLDKQKKALDDKNYKEYRSYDIPFHEVIVIGSGNSRLKMFWNLVIDEMKRIIVLALDDYELLISSFEEHKKLVEYLETGNTKEAVLIIKVHIFNIKEYCLKKMIL